MTEKYKYWSTVPRTFVQDCSSFLPFIFLFRLSSSSLIAVISSSRSRRNLKKHHNNKTRHPSLLRRDLTKKWRRRQRQKAIGLVSKTTTLHMHHAFLYIIVVPSLHDYDVKWPNFKTFLRTGRQGDIFYDLCLNSGVASSLQLQHKFPLKNRKMVWKHAESVFQGRFHGRRRCQMVRSLETRAPAEKSSIMHINGNKELLWPKRNSRDCSQSTKWYTYHVYHYTIRCPVLYYMCKMDSHPKKREMWFTIRIKINRS